MPDQRQTPEPQQMVLHATCIALHGCGCLIIGASGSGKSSLALSLMALGADLVSDDRVILIRNGDTVAASAPPAIHGLIEARGVGILTCDAVGPVQVNWVVDMDMTETERFPEPHRKSMLGLSLPLLYPVKAGHFVPALLQVLKSGRQEI